ncbi:hypothetical protein L1D40_11630 [Shewanella insulae]|uniref:hypothetical protein n=1 Tax=Shewanella insulae TaxID=2681496 RepID=UPI001EFDC662|nr:hypothetical protein [Shewanella insulae]MCG9755861.1 hypothetical protein [Shewanella insulae]
MSKLSDSFQKLGSDAALLEAYNADPEGVMKANGLTDEEIQVVLSGDKAQLDILSGDTCGVNPYLLITNPDGSR